MRKSTKFLLYTLVIVIVLLVSMTVLVNMLFDPNKFKGRISQYVHHETGRVLTIRGNIEHGFFPWLGLKVHDVEMSNASGFVSNSQFLRVGEMDVRIKLLPLMKGEVEVSKLILKDASLNLARNTAGQTNWSDLFDKKQKEALLQTQPAVKQATSHSFFKSLRITGIHVLNANVTWTDQKHNQLFKFSNVSFTIDDMAPGAPLPVTMTFDAAGLPGRLSGRYMLNAYITPDTRNHVYTLDDLSLNVVELLGDASSLAKGSASKVTLDLPDQTLDVTDFKLLSDTLKAEGDLHVEQLVDAPTYIGNIVINLSDVKGILKAMGKEMQMQDPGALNRLHLSAALRGTAHSLRFDSIDAQLDDSKIKGNVFISSFKPLAFDVGLSINQLNVDRYKTLTAQKTKSGNQERPVVSASTSAPAAPVAAAVTKMASDANNLKLLREVAVNAGVNIGLLTMGGITFSQAHVQLSLQNGMLNISPFTAQVYGGKTQVQVTANFGKDMPLYVVNKTLSNISLSQLSGSHYLLGLGNLEAQLTMQGTTKEEMLKSLNGAVQFHVDKGVFKGINIPFEVERAVALAKKQPVSQTPPIAETQFNVFSGTGTVKNGVFNNRDLLIESPGLKVTGQGMIDLTSTQMNYQLRAVGMQTVKNSDGVVVQQERQTVVPLRLTGSLSSPIVTPDVIAVARELFEENLKKTVDKNFQDVKEKAKGLFERLTVGIQ